MKQLSQTPEYWEQLAKAERTLAHCDRLLRRNVESIAIHLQNAQEYEANAARLRAGGAA